MKPEASRKRNYPSSEEILKFLEKGALIAIVWTSPVGGAELVKHFSLKLLDKVWEKYSRARLKEAVRRMVNRKLLEIKTVGEETIVTVSEKGKKKLLRYNFQEMKLQKPKIWDGKWRVVIFDVKEDKKSRRDSFRRKMIHLGFYPLQKSVFVTPYPCENEISFLRQYFGIGNEVSCFTATNLEEEEFLKEKFSLR